MSDLKRSIEEYFNHQDFNFTKKFKPFSEMSFDERVAFMKRLQKNDSLSQDHKETIERLFRQGEKRTWYERYNKNFIERAYEDYLFQFMSSESKIEKVPGHHLAEMLKFTFSKKWYESVLEQTIADEQQEYIEAIEQGKNYKAMWIKVRLWIIIAKTISMVIPLTLLKAVKGIVK